MQDALPTFPDMEAFECIEKELGMPLESVYSEITAAPIAAASLGQVYKARLRSTGQEVAVKVQRPGIEEAVGLDFYLVRILASFVDSYVDIITSSVVGLLDEFASRVYQELNYVQVGFDFCVSYPILLAIQKVGVFILK
jgi:predicted unusual protein kinase regulating ubiquinone biosynthesis (AarF/ABC1/UbiB family)